MVDVRLRLQPKKVQKKRVPLKLRTLAQILDPQPQTAQVLQGLLAWIDRADLAAQAGAPAPPPSTEDGAKLFPDTEWWLTDLERRSPEDRQSKIDGDAQLDEDDANLYKDALASQSESDASGSSSSDSDASLPAGPLPKHLKKDSGPSTDKSAEALSVASGAFETEVGGTCARCDAAMATPRRRLCGKQARPTVTLPQPGFESVAVGTPTVAAHATTSLLLQALGQVAGSPFPSPCGVNPEVLPEMSGQQMSYPMRFERQRHARCGLHALNNAIGFELLWPQDMTAALKVFLQESLMEGSLENPAWHASATGWYSEAVMATALRVKQNIFKLDLDNPVQNSAVSRGRLYDASVVGMVVNEHNTHWTAVRYVEGRIWKLDSVHGIEQLTPQGYEAYLAIHRNKFAVVNVA